MPEPICPFVLNTAGGEAPHRVEGQTAFRKDAIRVGKFFAKNPVDGSDLEIEVTPERIQRWVAAFQQMHQNGVSVDLTVDHKRGAEAKRGDVVSMFAEGDRLMFDARAADEDSEQLLQRCPEVSVEIEPNFRDGEGREYGEAITAVSVCRKPVVPDQQPFERIAASKQTDTAEGPAVWFAPDLETASGGEQENPMNRAMIRQALGVEESTSDQEVAEMVAKAMGVPMVRVETDMSQLAGKLSLSSDASVDDVLSKADESLTNLASENKRLRESNQPVQLSSDLKALATRTVDTELSRLVEKGAITEPTKDKLKPLLTSGATMLSLEATEGEQCLALQLCGALSHNDPQQLNQVTGDELGAQANLSREDGGDPSAPDDWVQEELKAANGDE